MGLPGNEARSAEQDRLESWKAIAAYLRHSERAVRRWEATEALPVHRHLHEQRGSVYAFRSELDAWREMRSQPPAPSHATGSNMEARPRVRTGLWALLS